VGFQVLGVFVGSSFFSGISSGWFCRVAGTAPCGKIGFKVFRWRFGLHWFLLALFRGFSFVRG